MQSLVLSKSQYRQMWDTLATDFKIISMNNLDRKLPFGKSPMTPWAIDIHDTIAK